MARHYLIYYNGTHSRLDGTWPYYCAITYFELVGIGIKWEAIAGFWENFVKSCFSYFMLFWVIYLLCKTNAHHFNIRVIWGFIGVEYFTQLTDRTVQIVLIFNHRENGQGTFLHVKKVFFLRCFFTCTIHDFSFLRHITGSLFTLLHWWVDCLLFLLLHLRTKPTLLRRSWAFRQLGHCPNNSTAIIASSISVVPKYGKLGVGHWIISDPFGLVVARFCTIAQDCRVTVGRSQIVRCIP